MIRIPPSAARLSDRIQVAFLSSLNFVHSVCSLVEVPVRLGMSDLVHADKLPMIALGVPDACHLTLPFVQQDLRLTLQWAFVPVISTMSLVSSAIDASPGIGFSDARS